MLARERLANPAPTKPQIGDLETQYLVALMKRDAREWAKRVQATLLGKEVADEVEAKEYNHQQQKTRDTRTLTTRKGKRAPGTPREGATVDQACHRLQNPRETFFGARLGRAL